jgi:hypothetical protein
MNAHPRMCSMFGSPLSFNTLPRGLLSGYSLNNYSAAHPLLVISSPHERFGILAIRPAPVAASLALEHPLVDCDDCVVRVVSVDDQEHGTRRGQRSSQKTVVPVLEEIRDALTEDK